MIETKAKISVGSMWFDSASPQFVNSLSQMLIYSQKTLCGPDEFIHYLNSPMSYHLMARNYLVEHALGEWLFMTDTDHVFAPDLLERLLRLAERHNSRVLSGLYLFKHPPHGPVANIRGADGGTEPLLDWDPTAEIMEVAHVGGGCLLIHRTVLEEVQRRFGCEPFNTIERLSEDYSFCERCHLLGIPVHLALTIESHHLTPRYTLSAQNYQRWRATQGAAVLATHPGRRNPGLEPEYS